MQLASGENFEECHSSLAARTRAPVEHPPDCIDLVMSF